MLSWAVGVAFGRFDIRLATSEREINPDPEPCDPLPAKSPGMVPDGDPTFMPCPKMEPFPASKNFVNIL